MNAAAEPRVGIVVPCFNEEVHLEVSPFAAFAALQPSVDFCFVNDGSTDSTQQRLEEISALLGRSAAVLRSGTSYAFLAKTLPNSPMFLSVRLGGCA